MFQCLFIAPMFQRPDTRASWPQRSFKKSQKLLFASVQRKWYNFYLSCAKQSSLNVKNWKTEEWHVTLIFLVCVSSIHTIPAAGDYLLPQPRITTSCSIFYAWTTLQILCLLKLSVTIVLPKQFDNVYFLYLCTKWERSHSILHLKRNAIYGGIIVRGWICH